MNSGLYVCYKPVTEKHRVGHDTYTTIIKYQSNTVAFFPSHEKPDPNHWRPLELYTALEIKGGKND